MRYDFIELLQHTLPMNAKIPWIIVLSFTLGPIFVPISAFMLYRVSNTLRDDRGYQIDPKTINRAQLIIIRRKQAIWGIILLFSILTIIAPIIFNAFFQT